MDEQNERSALLSARFGRGLAYFGTTASMIAVINNAVAGAGTAFLLRLLRPSASYGVAGVAGLLSTLVLTWVFYAYQRWRIDEYDTRSWQRAER